MAASSSSLSPVSPSSSSSPPTLRSRASSSNMRPALTAASLGSRRRSSSILFMAQPEPTVAEASLPPHVDAQPPPHDNDTPAMPQKTVLPATPTFEPHTIPAPAEPSSAASSMLPIVVRRALQLLQLGVRHPADLVAPTPPTPSPRSSTDTILPLSAPPDRTSFDAVFVEKERIRTGRSWRTNPSIHAPILFVIIMFPVSTALVLMALSTLPISVSWPRNISDLAQLGRELHGYTQSGGAATAHVVGVMAATAVWKHAWSIPGSVLWNVLAGALFTPAFATVLLTTLTAIGSLCATLLAMPLEPLITQFFPRALSLTRTALEGGAEAEMGKKPQSPAWVRLTVLRLIGVVPWSGLNIACGVCGVSLFDCALGAFIGTLPWTAVTCQIGDILQTVASQPSPTPQTVSSLVASPEIIAKLVFLSVLSLAPILGRDRLRAMLAGGDDAPAAADVERVGRWAWVRDWRVRIRMPSRCRKGAKGAKDASQLETLVQEKRREDMS